MAVWAVFSTVHKHPQCFQHYALTIVDHYWQGVQHNQICQFFLASDLNHHGNSHTQYTLVLLRVLSLNVYHQRKTALCLSLSTTTIQCHKLLHHHKVRTAQVWWLNLIIELAAVSIIHVQEM